MFPRLSIETYLSLKKEKNSHSACQIELPKTEIRTQSSHPNQLQTATDRSPQSPHPQSTPHMTLPRAGHTNIKDPHDICRRTCLSVPRASQHRRPCPLVCDVPSWAAALCPPWNAPLTGPAGLAVISLMTHRGRRTRGLCGCIALAPLLGVVLLPALNARKICVFMLSLLPGMSAAQEGKMVSSHCNPIPAMLPEAHSFPKCMLIS